MKRQLITLALGISLMAPNMHAENSNPTPTKSTRAKLTMASLKAAGGLFQLGFASYAIFKQTHKAFKIGIPITLIAGLALEASACQDIAHVYPKIVAFFKAMAKLAVGAGSWCLPFAAVREMALYDYGEYDSYFERWKIRDREDIPDAAVLFGVMGLFTILHFVSGKILIESGIEDLRAKKEDPAQPAARLSWLTSFLLPNKKGRSYKRPYE